MLCKLQVFPRIGAAIPSLEISVASKEIFWNYLTHTEEFRKQSKILYPGVEIVRYGQNSLNSSVKKKSTGSQNFLHITLKHVLLWYVGNTRKTKQKKVRYCYC